MSWKKYLPYRLYVLEQIVLGKQCRPKSDCPVGAILAAYLDALLYCKPKWLNFRTITVIFQIPIFFQVSLKNLKMERRK